MFPHLSKHYSAPIKTNQGTSEDKLIHSLTHIMSLLSSSTLIFQHTNLSFYFRSVRSLVIIFVFNAPRNKIKDSLKVCMDYNIFILGTFQTEKLTKTIAACFARHPGSQSHIQLCKIKQKKKLEVVNRFNVETEFHAKYVETAVNLLQRFPSYSLKVKLYLNPGSPKRQQKHSGKLNCVFECPQGPATSQSHLHYQVKHAVGYSNMQMFDPFASLFIDDMPVQLECTVPACGHGDGGTKWKTPALSEDNALKHSDIPEPFIAQIPRPSVSGGCSKEEFNIFTSKWERSSPEVDTTKLRDQLFSCPDKNLRTALHRSHGAWLSTISVAHGDQEARPGQTEQQREHAGSDEGQVRTR